MNKTAALNGYYFKDNSFVTKTISSDTTRVGNRIYVNGFYTVWNIEVVAPSYEDRAIFNAMNTGDVFSFYEYANYSKQLDCYIEHFYNQYLNISYLKIINRNKNTDDIGSAIPYSQPARSVVHSAIKDITLGGVVIDSKNGDWSITHTPKYVRENKDSEGKLTRTYELEDYLIVFDIVIKFSYYGGTSLLSMNNTIVELFMDDYEYQGSVAIYEDDINDNINNKIQYIEMLNTVVTGFFVSPVIISQSSLDLLMVQEEPQVGTIIYYDIGIEPTTDSPAYNPLSPPQIGTATLPANPLLTWLMNEDANNNVVSDSSNTYDGASNRDTELMSVVGRVAGTKALGFNISDSDRIDFGTSAIPKLTNNISFSGWFKATGVFNSDRQVFLSYYGDWWNSYTGVTICLVPGGTVELRKATWIVTIFSISTTLLYDDDKWHFFCAVLDSNDGMKLQVDDEIVTNTITEDIAHKVGTKVTVGNFWGSASGSFDWFTYDMDGALANYHIYERSLATLEIEALRGGGVAGDVQAGDTVIANATVDGQWAIPTEYEVKAILPEGIATYLFKDNLSTNVVADENGNYNAELATGTTAERSVTGHDGALNSAFSFNDSYTERIILPEYPDFRVSQGGTGEYSFWTRLRVATVGRVFSYSNADIRFIFEYYSYRVIKAFFGAVSGGGWVFYNGGDELDFDTFFDFGISAKENNTCNVYINGVLVGSTSIGLFEGSTGGRNYGASYTDVGKHLLGVGDQLRVFDKQLSDAEFESLSKNLIN